MVPAPGSSVFGGPGQADLEAGRTARPKRPDAAVIQAAAWPPSSPLSSLGTPCVLSGRKFLMQKRPGGGCAGETATLRCIMRNPCAVWVLALA